jgi:uncharacterized protein YqgC (DUF456 family)
MKLKTENIVNDFLCCIFGGTFLGAAIYNMIGAIIGCVFGLCFSLYYQHIKNKKLK